MTQPSWPSHRRHVGRISRRKIGVCRCLLVAIVSGASGLFATHAWSALRLVEQSNVSSSYSSKEVLSEGRALPLFSPPRMPRDLDSSGNPLSGPLDHWAAAPMTGSYRFDDGVSTIHMPALDLQEYYKGSTHHSGLSMESLNISQAALGDECVVLTRKGNKYSQTGVASNQDRVAVIDYGSIAPGEGEWWMGLFDGHGEYGHVISQFALYEFPKHLAKLRQKVGIRESPEALKSVLSHIFLKIHSDLPRITGSGSTGISIWKRHGQLVISNVGDSQAFVLEIRRQDGDVSCNVVYETRPYKPDDRNEKARIEKMGGTVQPAPAPGYSARVLIPIGSPPVDVMGLAMSRSLGDHEGSRYGVIAEPTTDILDLSSWKANIASNVEKIDYVVILASDGLLDRISEQEIAEAIAETMLMGSSHDTIEVAENLILKSSHLWNSDLRGGGYRDDISLAVHRLRI